MVSKKIQIDAKARTEGAVKGIEKLSNEMKELRAGTDKANDSFSQAQKMATKLGPALGGIGAVATGAAAGIVAIGGGLAALANHAATSAVEIRKWSDRIGESNKNVQFLKFVAGQAGAEFDETAEAVKTMRENLGEMQRLGTGPAVDALMSLGLSMKDIIDLPMDKQLGVVGDALNSLQNDSKRLSVAIELMGEDGARLLPLFRKGSQGVAELRQEFESAGIAISDSGIEKSAEMAQEMAKLRQQLSNVAVEVGSALLPHVKKLGDGISRWVERNDGFIKQDLPNKIGEIADAMGVLAEAAFKTLEVVSKLVLAFTQIPRAEKSVGEVTGEMLAAAHGLAQTNIVFTKSREEMEAWAASVQKTGKKLEAISADAFVGPTINENDLKIRQDALKARERSSSVAAKQAIQRRQEIADLESQVALNEQLRAIEEQEAMLRDTDFSGRLEMINLEEQARLKHLETKIAELDVDRQRLEIQQLEEEMAVVSHEAKMERRALELEQEQHFYDRTQDFIKADIDAKKKQAKEEEKAAKEAEDEAERRQEIFEGRMQMVGDSVAGVYSGVAGAALQAGLAQEGSIKAVVAAYAKGQAIQMTILAATEAIRAIAAAARYDFFAASQHGIAAGLAAAKAVSLAAIAGVAGGFGGGGGGGGGRGTSASFQRNFSQLGSGGAGASAGGGGGGGGGNNLPSGPISTADETGSNSVNGQARRPRENGRTLLINVTNNNVVGSTGEEQVRELRKAIQKSERETGFV